MNKLRILEAVDQPRAAVWDELEQYAEVVTVRDGECAYQLLCERKFDLVLVNLMLAGLDGLELLRRIKKRNLCPLVVLTSEYPDFRYAQQGIIYGAFDYLLRPVTKEQLMELILRAEQMLWKHEYKDQHECNGLVQAVGSEAMAKRYDMLVEQFAREQNDVIQLDIRIRRMYETVIRQTFADLPWLERFAYIEDYDSIDWIRTSNPAMVRDLCRRKLLAFSDLVADLYPRTDNKTLRNYLNYILLHIDDGFRQKDIADAFYISSTALSELFHYELGYAYREYVLKVKMRRAEYLMLHSDMKIYEISALLGYKDVNYFSRMFKRRYGIPLSQLRSQNQQDYTI